MTASKVLARDRLGATAPSQSPKPTTALPSSPEVGVKRRGAMLELALCSLVSIGAVGIHDQPWPGTAGPFRSSRADTGAQVLPPARAIAPPWLRASSSRVSSLLACYAPGPPASAAPCSCRREPCTGRSAWLSLGRACPSAWIEYRSGRRRSL